MRAFRSIALALALLFAASVSEHAQTQTNKHVTTGEVKQGWTGDGATAVFKLDSNPTGPAALLVYVNGLYQSEPEDYRMSTVVVSGKATTSITFTSAPSTGDRIRVKYVGEFTG